MPTEFDKRFDAIIETTLHTLAAGIHPLTPALDANPKGLEAVVLSAALRAYADVIEMRFDEGEQMGPLKTAVDEVRSRMTLIFQKGAAP